MALIIKIVLLMLLLGVSVALFVQNSAPIAITVLGVPTQPISIGLSIVAAALLGLFMGVVLQYVLRGAPALRSPKFPRLKRTKAKSRRPKQQKTPKQVNRAPANPSASDWYQPASRDWHDRSPQASGRAYESRSPQDYDDADRPPRSRWSSLFETEEDEASYVRREKQEPGSDRVVDADFRVIRPPTRPLTDPEWDDEFFDDKR